MRKALSFVKSFVPFKNLKSKLTASPQKRAQIQRIRTLSSIDSIEQFDLFCDTLSPFLHSDHIISEGRYAEEAYFYGHYDAIARYAGVKKGYTPVFTELEHGVRFGTPKWKPDSFLVFACQGPERVTETIEKDPNAPIYIIGPYIRYAQDYYTEEQLRRKKESLGRTLLVFPGHTCETDGNIQIEPKLFKTVYSRYAKDFDTVMVCIYWNDVDDPVVDLYRKQGAVLVSAGFRGDPHFITRLRTILHLSDLVLSDDIGTNIGYCLALQKPVILHLDPSHRDLINETYAREFTQAFSAESGSFTHEQLAQQQALYRRFWGGDAFMLRPEEMQKLITQLDQVYRRNLYSTVLIKRELQRALTQPEHPDYDAICRYHYLNRWGNKLP